MYFIPGIVISVITFPGVMVHELAHAIFCKLLRVPIYDIKYFQFKNPTGYVVHEPTDNHLKSLIITVGPFIINTVLGMLITLPVAVSLVVFRDSDSLLNYFLGWIGFSILMHAFPSTGDAENLLDSIMKSEEVSVIFKIITFPILALIYLGAYGSMLWLDFLYAGAVAVYGNELLLHLFM